MMKTFCQSSNSQNPIKEITDAFSTLATVKTIIAVLFFFVSASSFADKFELTNETTFLPASSCAQYNESYPQSSGGTLFLFVRNNGDEPETISDVLINGTSVSKTPGVKWFRCWPHTIFPAPGDSVCGITIQSTAPPIANGEKITIDVKAESGASDSQVYSIAPPGLRIVNVIPSQDMRALDIYIRNDSTLSFTVNNVIVNNKELKLGINAGLTIAGGDFDVLPGKVDIIKFKLEDQIPPLGSLAIRVGTTVNGTKVWTGALLRAVTPWFPLGTWSSALADPKNEASRDMARKLRLDFAVTGNNWKDLEGLYNRHYIQSMNFISKGSPEAPDVDTINEHDGNPGINAWMVRDEPELNGISSSEMLKNNQVFWDEDPNHPTFLNLMTTRGFNEFGNIPDIVGMDHYAQYASNNIPRTGILRKARMEETIDYAWSLKLNTEPKRMWVWSQLANENWTSNPNTWGVDYQFWGQIMCGAKGVLWFTYGPNREKDYPNQIAEAVKLTRQFSKIRNLCLYGEPADCVDVGDAKIQTKALLSENAMIVILLNNNYSTPGFPWSPYYNPKRQQGSITVNIPKWIKPATIYQVTSEVNLAPNYSVEDNTVRIDYNFQEESVVLLIGARDTEPPAMPDPPANISDDPAKMKWSWREPFDNYGVKGFKLFENGAEIADVDSPLCSIDKPQTPGAKYTVAAYDNAGNISQQSNPALQ